MTIIDLPKKKKVSELPEADSLDGLYVFGYAPKNAVDKRSVKAPITLLKGNKGDTGAAGKDGDVTAAQLEEALSGNAYLVTEEANGLMSKEDKKQLNEIIEYMKPLEEKYDSFVHLTLNNAKAVTILRAIEFGALGDDVVLEVDGVKSKIAIERYSNILSVSPTKEKGDVKLWLNANVLINLFYLLGAIDNVRVTSRGTLTDLVMSEARVAILDVSGVKNLEKIQCGYTRLEILDFSNNRKLISVSATNNDNLTRINIDGAAAQILSLSNCPKLTAIQIISETLPALKSLYVSKTGLSKNSIVSIGKKWGSRVGLDTGILSLDAIIYNEMSTDERKIFTDKNITFNIVA